MHTENFDHVLNGWPLPCCPICKVDIGKIPDHWYLASLDTAESVKVLVRHWVFICTSNVKFSRYSMRFSSFSAYGKLKYVGTTVESHLDRCNSPCVADLGRLSFLKLSCFWRNSKALSIVRAWITNARIIG